MSQESEQLKIQEPIDTPITDFVIENIAGYDELKADTGEMGEKVFEQKLADALSIAYKDGKIDFEQPLKESFCFDIYFGLVIDGKPKDFILKCADIGEERQKENEWTFEDLKKEHELVKRYFGDLVLPTAFIQVDTGENIRNFCVQRDLSECLNPGENVKKCKANNIPVSEEFKRQYLEFVNFSTKMLSEETKLIDGATFFNDAHGNLRWDDSSQKLWLVDTNHIRRFASVFGYGSKEEARGYIGMAEKFYKSLE